MASPPKKLTPTTAPFEPASTLIKGELVNATFFTRHPPDVPRDARIIGLCTVPYDRAGGNDLGWHISDFLAFKCLFKGLNAKNQTWLAHCDIRAAVRRNPSSYKHSNADVTVAAFDETTPIAVEPSARRLTTKMTTTVHSMSSACQMFGAPLIIIVCGTTTMEQDIYFGDNAQKYDVSLTSEQLGAALVTSGLRVTVVTPSLFSAGWQVNPSFGVSLTGAVDRLAFVAKQAGAIFADALAEKFVHWYSPFIDQDAVDKANRARERFPEPVPLSDEQKRAKEAFEVEIHSLLAARLMPKYKEHCFSFDPTADPWIALVGPRQGLRLEEFAQQWHKLPVVMLLDSDQQQRRLEFLGSAFGGNKSSQVAHIKHLIKESFSSWPGYYETTFGQQVQQELGVFLAKMSPMDLDCHEIFNIMEHRLSLVGLGDLLVKYANLRAPVSQRCRDWNELRENAMALEGPVLLDLANAMISPPSMPPGANYNRLKPLHTRLDRPFRYLAAALYLRYDTKNEAFDDAIDRLRKFLRQIKEEQIKQLATDPDVHAKGKAWFESINIPVATCMKAKAQAGTPLSARVLPIAATSFDLQAVNAATTASAAYGQARPSNQILHGLAPGESNGMTKSMATVAASATAPASAGQGKLKGMAAPAFGRVKDTNQTVHGSTQGLNNGLTKSIANGGAAPMSKTATDEFEDLAKAFQALKPTRKEAPQAAPINQDLGPDPEGHLPPHLRKHFRRS